MSWLFLVIVGLIVLAVSFAPIPHPVPLILRWVGAIMVVVGLVLLLLGVFNTSTVDSDVDVDGAAAHSLVLE